MFAASMGFSAPPQTFQTYLLPTVPFRRRKSSTEAVPTASSLSSIPSASDDGSVPTSPISTTSPMTPGSPTSSTSSSSYEITWPTHSHHASISSVSSSPAKMEALMRPSYLSGSTSHISCSRCHADLALTSQIISKGFTGRHGRAYLVAASPCPLNSTPSTPGSSGLAGSSVGSLPNTHTHKAMPRHLVTGLHTVCDISCAVCGTIVGWKYIGAEEESQRYKVGKFILETRRVSVGCCWENDEASDNEEALGDGGDGGWKYDFESRRMSSIRKDIRRRSSSSGGYGIGLGMGFGLSLGFGSGSAATESKQMAMQEEEDDEADIMFDSQDEDECEDLFAGIWSPQLARRRRTRKMSIK